MDRIATSDTNVIFQEKGGSTMGFTIQGNACNVKVYEESGIARKERINNQLRDKLLNSEQRQNESIFNVR